MNYTIYFRKQQGLPARNRKKNRDVTVAAVLRTSPEGNQELAFGYTICSTKEQFVKAKGRAVASGRAMSKTPAKVVPVDTDKVTEYFKQHAEALYKEVLKIK
jgi:hypothetical protein